VALFGFGKKTDLVGLDIGSSTIKVAALKELKKGRGYQLTQFAVAPIPSEAIVDGSILDASIVIEAIQKLFGENGIKNRNVAINVSGAAVTIKRISLPPMTYAELSESITLEAEQYLPFGIDDVNIDFRIMEKKITEGENMDVLLVAAKKDKINDYVSVVSQAGLVPMVVDVDVFALQNCYEINHEVGEALTVLVDIGASVTNINIMHGDNSIFWRDLNVGGKKYNEVLQRELRITEEQAEQAKRGDTAQAAVPIEQVIPVINGVSEDIVKEISRTVDFCRHSTMDKAPDKVVLSGGGARTMNLDKFLGDALKAQVEILNPFAHVMVDPKKFDFEWLAQYVPAASVAVGLGVRRVGDL
jgi:type IV pilus assembly protein PilM